MILLHFKFFVYGIILQYFHLFGSVYFILPYNCVITIVVIIISFFSILVQSLFMPDYWCFKLDSKLICILYVNFWRDHNSCCYRSDAKTANIVALLIFYYNIHSHDKYICSVGHLILISHIIFKFSVCQMDTNWTFFSLT